MKNPIPTVHVYDLTSKETSLVDLKDDTNGDFYVYDVLWKNNNQFAVVKLNRIQDEKILLVGTITTTSRSASSNNNKKGTQIPNNILSTSIYNNRTQNFGWFAHARSIFFIPGDDDKFVDIDIYDGYYHLVLYQGPTLLRSLTSGDFLVRSLFKSYDLTKKKLYV